TDDKNDEERDPLRVTYPIWPGGPRCQLYVRTGECDRGPACPEDQPDTAPDFDRHKHLLVSHILRSVLQINGHSPLCRRSVHRCLHCPKIASYREGREGTNLPSENGGSRWPPAKSCSALQQRSGYWRSRQC
ncbi:unnamed protein product, partial [Phaeothamnion confervicola]